VAIPSHVSPRPGESLAGDPGRLAEQLGSIEDLAVLGPGLARAHAHRITDATSLRRFLLDYVQGTLVPGELPVITRAHRHAQQYEVGELIAMDQGLSLGRLAPELAEASRRVGGSQLRRLRPLRDQRLVQRYLRAVETGQAHGWHTVVYGLVLSLYSLPLRQGLLGYGNQTIRGLVNGAAARLPLTQDECVRIEEEAGASLPAAVQALLTPPDGAAWQLA
jgi:urease accessory protein UreF